MSKRRSYYANIYRARGAKTLQPNVSTFGATTSRNHAQRVPTAGKSTPTNNLLPRYGSVKKKRIITLYVGQVVVGTVKRLEEYGALVELRHVTGLVHISEMSWRYVAHPKLSMEIGRNVKVIVTSIDHIRSRVNLSIKRLTCRACERPIGKGTADYMCNACRAKLS